MSLARDRRHEVGNALGPSPFRVVAAFGLVAVALALGYRLIYQSQERYQRNDAQEALSAVSRLKVSQISGWLEDRLSDGAVLSEDSALTNQVRDTFPRRRQPARAVLRSGLVAWKEHKGYTDVAVADPGGNVVFSLSGETGQLPRRRGERPA